MHISTLNQKIGFCRICGLKASGISFDVWVKETFTNFDNLKQGDVICKNCLFKFDEHSKMLAKKVGKEKPQRMRNYSHFIVNGEWIPLGKDKKSRMADLLLSCDPKLAVISESGQKHLWFRAKPGMWQFEEQSIIPDKELLRWLLIRIEKLMQTFSKTEIKSGRYNQKRILDFGLQFWAHIENEIKQHRGSQYFELALFLGQSDGQFGKHCSESARSDKNEAETNKDTERFTGSKVLSFDFY